MPRLSRFVGVRDTGRQDLRGMERGVREERLVLEGRSQSDSAPCRVQFHAGRAQRHWQAHGPLDTLELQGEVVLVT